MKNYLTKNILIWLQGAAELPGKGPILMALAIQSLSQDEGRLTQLHISPGVIHEIGMHRTTAKRALAQLQAAELIDVDQERGEDPVVEILGIDDLCCWWKRKN